MGPEVNASDKEILKVLKEGRSNPAHLTDETGLSRQTIHNRLNILVARGAVQKVHESGLYELKEDPRENTGN